MITQLIQPPLLAARRGYERWRLPVEAKSEIRRDREGLPAADPGIDRSVDAAIQWLCEAQDNSATGDGGVARHYSLIRGWGASYPETTGYIVPTMIACAERRNDPSLRQRARRMLDWLVSIQFPDGGFQGGLITATPAVPVTFNTGQILIGLAAGAAAFGEYGDAMRRAADWLTATQDADGCWRRFPTPFAAAGEKTYETHVAWGLFEAARLEPAKPYADAAMANIRWALARQQSNGWVEDCCLTDAARPLTHTLGYALRGFLEAHRFGGDDELLERTRRTADGLLGCLREDGFLPGRLRADWSAAADWACLTGTVQIAHCWLRLYQITGETVYREAGRRANRHVRRTIRTAAPPSRRGGVKGSFPVDGEYGRFEYLNWAAKFFIDANLLEAEIIGP